MQVHSLTLSHTYTHTHSLTHSHDAYIHTRCALQRSADESDIHPAAPGIFELWGGANTDARKLMEQEEIHFRTDRDSFLIKSFYLTKAGS